MNQFVSEWLQVCSVCFGPADQQTAQAINGAVFFMIGVTGVVLTGLTGFVIHMIRTANSKNNV